jgi:hypothetical protein
VRLIIMLITWSIVFFGANPFGISISLFCNCSRHFI